MAKRTKALNGITASWTCALTDHKYECKRVDGFWGGRDLDWVYCDVGDESVGLERTTKRQKVFCVHADETRLKVTYPDALSGMKPGKYVAWPKDAMSPEEFEDLFANFEDKRAHKPLTTYEFFAGSAHLSREFANVGFDYTMSTDLHTNPPCYHSRHETGVDFDRCFETSTKFWSRRFNLTSIASVLHFSPVCTTYSQLATSTHQRHRGNNFLGVTQEAFKANATLLRVYHILMGRKRAGLDVVFTIENPDSAFSYHPVIKAICRDVGAVIVNLTFCAFGETHRKPTCLVTNCQTLIGLAQKEDAVLKDPDFFGDVCEYIEDDLVATTADNNGEPVTIEAAKWWCVNKGGRCCFNRGCPHDGVTVRNGFEKGKLVAKGKDTSEVVAFPSMLCKLLASCMMTDATRVREERQGYKPCSRCENPACAFLDKHAGPCSYEFAVHSMRARQ